MNVGSSDPDPTPKGPLMAFNRRLMARQWWSEVQKSRRRRDAKLRLYVDPATELDYVSEERLNGR